MAPYRIFPLTLVCFLYCLGGQQSGPKRQTARYKAVARTPEAVTRASTLEKVVGGSYVPSGYYFSLLLLFFLSFLLYLLVVIHMVALTGRLYRGCPIHKCSEIAQNFSYGFPETRKISVFSW